MKKIGESHAWTSIQEKYESDRDTLKSSILKVKNLCSELGYKELLEEYDKILSQPYFERINLASMAVRMDEFLRTGFCNHEYKSFTNGKIHCPICNKNLFEFPTVVLVGGSGYIGSQIAGTLLESGIHIINIDKVDPNEILNSHENYKFYKLDIREWEGTSGMGRGISELKNRLNYIGLIHLAGDIGELESKSDPYKYYTNNLESLTSSMKLADSLGITRFIFSSSSSVYDKSIIGEFKESDKTRVDNPYSTTKLIGELMVRDLGDQFGIQTICLRYFNPIGETKYTSDKSNSLFGNIISCLRSNRTLEIYGNDYETYDGTCIRDFISIEDLADAHQFLLQIDLSSHETFNLGSGVPISVLQVTDLINELTELKFEFKNRRSEDRAGIVANMEKLSLLGFKCTRPIRSTIKTLIELNK